MSESTVRLLALGNLALQLALVGLLAVSAYYVRARHYRHHCRVMRVAVPLQIVGIIAVMLPSLVGYLGDPPASALFMPEVLAHHFLGLVPVVLWVYFNLGFAHLIRLPRRLKPYMLTAAGAWGASLLLGLHLFVRIWV